MNTQTQTRAPPKAEERWGPEIYLHVEFRMSWTKKQQPPKNHQLTYKSRSARERATLFPRQVPAPNTNYLAAIHNFDQRQSRMRGLRQQQASNDPRRHHQLQEYYQGVQPHAMLEVPLIREPQPRPTRADARPTHERGRSAPPPIGENPWDVSIPQIQIRSSDVPPPDRTTTEIRRKPLPAPPSQFRLGEGGQPWSTWSLPDGYDPDMHPRDEDDDRPEPLPVGSPLADRNSTTFATNPTMVSTFSPEPASSPVRTRDLETGRVRELGALSAAMMTVDNGFETQWWFQGKRHTVCSAGDEPQSATTPDESPVNRWSTGPFSRGEEDSAAVPETPIIVPSGVVSPVSDAAFSPAQVPASLLQRTMSTRSEELWFRQRGA